MIGALGLRAAVHYGYLVIIMHGRNRRIERSGVAVVEERTLRVVPDSAEVRAARIIASLRGDTTPANCQGQSATGSGAPVLRLMYPAKRQRATG